MKSNIKELQIVNCKYFDPLVTFRQKNGGLIEQNINVN